MRYQGVGTWGVSRVREDVNGRYITLASKARKSTKSYKMKGSVHFMVISQQGIAQRAPPRSGNMKQWGHGVWVDYNVAPTIRLASRDSYRAVRLHLYLTWYDQPELIEGVCSAVWRKECPVKAFQPPPAHVHDTWQEMQNNFFNSSHLTYALLLLAAHSPIHQLGSFCVFYVDDNVCDG
jgi:hypothetical protein